MATTGPEKVTAPDASANAALRAWAESVAGAQVEIVDRSRGFGQPSIVWELQPMGSERLFLKRSGSSAHFRRARHANEHWIPQLDGERFHFPTRVGTNEELLAFVATALDGPVVETMDLKSADVTFLMHEAGALARAIHALPVEEAVDPVAYMGHKVSRYLQPSEHVDPRDIDWVLALVDEGRAFDGCAMVGTHGDWSPRNWLRLDNEGLPALGAIDWERARVDVWLEDMQRMTHDHWYRFPWLREAFFDGYGRRPTEPEARQLKMLTLVASLAAIPYACKHEDEGFAKLSRQMFERARREFRDQ